MLQLDVLVLLGGGSLAQYTSGTYVYVSKTYETCDPYTLT